ncbi:MAG: fibronectin type III domain-containing protein [Treponema sp.]|jgi:hypothetical protein|nr:fibronectin type III domain-containing protein [Treponema sp.]
MKSKLYLMVILYLLFACSGSLFGIGEKTISLGGDAIWKMADYRAGITEASLVRTGPVLILSSKGEPRISDATLATARSVEVAGAGAGNSGSPRGRPATGLFYNTERAKPAPDLLLSFDEGHHERFRDSSGNYQIYTSSSLTAVDRRYARSGAGAVLFSGPDINRKEHSPLTVKAQGNSALFAANKRIGDFSIEFWLNPQNMENGEQILLWISSLPAQSTRGTRVAATDHIFQRILCVSSKNRLQWSFLGFFLSPDVRQSLDIIIKGQSAIVPKTWSHHLIRFDSVTGMIEYSINGKVEAIDYATSTRREGGEVYTPVAGEGGEFVLGGGFSGLMDEFMIHGGVAPSLAIQKYPLRGGRIETGAIDLGDGSNNVLKVEASGGRTQIQNARTGSEYKRNGRFLFSDNSEMQFFIRGSNNPYRWDSAWYPVTPGLDIEGSVSGRYVQLAVDFYPSADGETSPYLEELRVTYMPDEPPLPPTRLTAVAMDGAVQLQWRSSPDANTIGYLVYYGSSASGDYLGEDAALGVSPVDVGKRNSVIIDGLKNGTLYYFRVAAYGKKDPDTIAATHIDPRHIGDFSTEVRARPLTGLSKR